MLACPGADVELLKGSIAAVMALIWVFAGPVTYVLLILETWRSTASPVVKIIISVTLDPVLSAFWPVTWGYWIWEWSRGEWSPISLFAG